MNALRLSAIAICATAAGGFGATLDEVLDPIAPDVKKWASVCVVGTRPDGTRPDGTSDFTWHDYRGSADARDFWPASAVKIYTAVAALELLHEHGFALDTTLTFEHGDAAGKWTLDCARSIREMLSEVFRRSSNEDYTLLLRFVGLDRLNAGFLTPEKGFPHSALMRGYVVGRPWEYRRAEPQRITLRSTDGRTQVIEHTWSGRFYSEERGGTIIDARTGNVTSPRELAECLRRIVFHEQLPEAERYRLTPEALAFLRHGGEGLTGLETKDDESGPLAWKGGADAVFPQARYFHKCGWISNYALDLACIDDRAQSGRCFLLVPVAAAGDESKPEKGQIIITKMSRAIAEWARTH